MKRTILICISIIFLITLCSCNNPKTPSKEEVVINMPENDSVNGFKTSSVTNTTESTSSKIESEPETSDINIQYCANVKSKVFHISSCHFVSKMKDENKYFISNRDELISEGYKPCSSCKP